MSLVFFRLFVAGALLAGCTREEGTIAPGVVTTVSAQATQVAAAPLARSQPPAKIAQADSPFHDAVVSYKGHDDMMPNGLHVCPFRDETFICGVSNVPLVATDDDVVGDDALEARIESGKATGLDGRVIATCGSVKRGAWMITQAVASARQHAYRLRNDAWSEFAVWSSASGSSCIADGDGLLLAPLLSTARENDWRQYSVVRVAHGDDRFRPLPLRRIRQAAQGLVSPVKAVFEGDRSVGLVAVDGTKVIVDRLDRQNGWKESVETVRDVGAPEATLQAWGDGGELAVVFGTVAHRPIFERYHDRTWSTGVLPAGVETVAAYDRTSKVERVFTESGPMFSLFERDLTSPESDVGSWKRIPLPTLPEDQPIKQVWLANDDAWLLVYPKDSERIAPRLMRMKPVKKVWTYREPTTP